MMKYFRRVLLSGLAGLALAGVAANANAEGEQEAAKAECIAQAEENGLEGAERNQFVQECIAGMDTGDSGQQPQQ